MRWNLVYGLMLAASAICTLGVATTSFDRDGLNTGCGSNNAHVESFDRAVCLSAFSSALDGIEQPVVNESSDATLPELANMNSVATNDSSRVAVQIDGREVGWVETSRAMPSRIALSSSADAPSATAGDNVYVHGAGRFVSSSTRSSSYRAGSTSKRYTTAATAASSIRNRIFSTLQKRHYQKPQWLRDFSRSGDLQERIRRQQAQQRRNHQ